MSTSFFPLFRLQAARRWRRLLSQESGIATVEFALILPILLTLWIGGVEVTSALSVDRRLNNLASSIGDLVARSKEKMTYAEVEDIFDIAPGAMFPYRHADETGALVAMRISAVDIDDEGEAEVAWSRARGPDGFSAYEEGHEFIEDEVPTDLRVENSQIIMSEVLYTYRPAIGYVITRNIDLEERMFFVPRVVTEVKLCEDDATPLADCD